MAILSEPTLYFVSSDIALILIIPLAPNNIDEIKPMAHICAPRPPVSHTRTPTPTKARMPESIPILCMRISVLGMTPPLPESADSKIPWLTKGRISLLAIIIEARKAIAGMIANSPPKALANCNTRKTPAIWTKDLTNDPVNIPKFVASRGVPSSILRFIKIVAVLDISAITTNMVVIGKRYAATAPAGRPIRANVPAPAIVTADVIAMRGRKLFIMDMTCCNLYWATIVPASSLSIPSDIPATLSLSFVMPCCIFLIASDSALIKTIENTSTAKNIAIKAGLATNNADMLLPKKLAAIPCMPTCAVITLKNKPSKPIELRPIIIALKFLGFCNVTNKTKDTPETSITSHGANICNIPITITAVMIPPDKTGITPFLIIVSNEGIFLFWRIFGAVVATGGGVAGGIDNSSTSGTLSLLRRSSAILLYSCAFSLFPKSP